jgi:NADH pyrophosphatase NudC (nudix superfamily)
MALLANSLAEWNVSVRHCDWCGQRFYQGRDNHRFCKRECGVQFFAAERRTAKGFFRSLRNQEGEEG